MNNVYIEITDACNLHCSFCPSATIEDRSFMDSSLFQRCIEEAKRANAENVYFHVLGEPTLHPGFMHYVKKLATVGLKLTLTTNGTNIFRVGKGILQNDSIRQVNFSIHAYAELPKEKAEEHLQNVLDFCKMASVTRQDLYVNLRLWNIGDESALPWNEYALSQIGKCFDKKISIGNFSTRHKSFNVEGRIYIHEDTRFEWPKLQEPVHDPFNAESENAIIETMRGTCRALDTHTAILHDGTVVACCLDYGGSLRLGNIKENGLVEILNGKMALWVRDGFKNHELRHPLCRKCAYCKRFK